MSMSSRLLLVLLGLLLGAVVAELLLRLTGTAPEVGATSFRQYRISQHPAITYELAPGMVIGADRTNELGYRGPLVPLAAVRGSRRIIVIGDSISEGLGIRQYADVFPAVVEQLLNDSNLRTEVIDLGVYGFDTVQEVATLRHKGLRFGPDLVILQYCHNDLVRDDGAIGEEILERTREGHKVEQAWAHDVFLKSALYRFAKYRALRWYLEPKLRRSWEYRATQGFERIAGAFADLARLQEKHGFEVLIVVFPRFSDGLCPYPHLDEHVRIADLAADHGFHLLDLLDTFRHCADINGGTAWKDHVHPNVDGHRCAGEAIADEILRAGFFY